MSRRLSVRGLVLPGTTGRVNFGCLSFGIWRVRFGVASFVFSSVLRTRLDGSKMGASMHLLHRSFDIWGLFVPTLCRVTGWRGVLVLNGQRLRFFSLIVCSRGSGWM